MRRTLNGKESPSVRKFSTPYVVVRRSDSSRGPIEIHPVFESFFSLGYQIGLLYYRKR